MSMKFLPKTNRLIPLFAFLLLFACGSDNSTDDVDDQPIVDPDSRSIAVSFSTPIDIEEPTGHQYIFDGYTVIIEGVNKDTTFTDVNLLTGPFEAQVSGDVVITVFHPDFNPSALVTGAYFGLENAILPTSSQTDINIDLELVQGFVIVKTVDGAENQVSGLAINGTEANLNTYYYTATDKVTVYIVTVNGILTGTDDLVIGEGIKYTVDPINFTFTVTFPTFGEGTDGELNQGSFPVITKDNVNKYESYKLYQNGTVDIFTGGLQTDIFIPSKDLESGHALSQYDISGLKASWKTNTGETNIGLTGYTNIYLQTLEGEDIRVAILSNGYIQVDNTSQGTNPNNYGDYNASSNPNAYSQLLSDYGSAIVKHNWFDSVGTIGNFIWRAKDGDGTIFVEDYSISVSDAAPAAITAANVLGATINYVDQMTGTVGLIATESSSSIFVLSDDLIAGATLADYDATTVFNGLDVVWDIVTTPGDTGYINVYLRKGLGNKARLDIMQDGSLYVDGVLYDSLDSVLESFGDYEVRTDYIENQGLKAINGNFVWRSGSQRGTLRVNSYKVQ